MKRFRPALMIGTAAGIAGLARDVPATAALIALPAAGSALLFLLSHPAAWVSIFIASSLLLPPLPVEAGTLELPLHPAIFIFAAAAFVGWVRLREWRIQRDALTAACVLLPAALLASLPWAFYYSGTSVGLQSAIRWLLLCQGFLVLAWLAWGPADGFDTGLLIRVVLAAAFLSAAFAVVDFFYQFPTTVRFGQQYIWLADGRYRRAQGVFYEANALGNFCALAITLILALWRDGPREWRIPRWLLWAPMPPLAIALVLSFSRAAIVNVAVALGVLVWLRRNSFRRLWGFVLAAALALAAAFSIVLLAPDIASRYGQHLEFSALQFYSDPNAVLSTRLETWTFLLNFIAGHPLQVLLGIGYKSLPYTEYFPQAVIADNMYLSVLVESGLPGLAALLFFCGAVLVYTRRLSRHADAAIAALGAFLFAAWCGEMVHMLSGDVLTYWRVTPVYLALFGVALRASRERA